VSNAGIGARETHFLPDV